MKVNKQWAVYYFATTSNCKIIYYETINGKTYKRLREISFSQPEIDPIRCVLTFKGIASKFGELLPYEPNKWFQNGVYTYYSGKYEGYVTTLDMNSAYLYALTQPLADWQTRTECTFEDVISKKYDYFCFENSINCVMFYKEDYLAMLGAKLWADVKIYGYKASRHYIKTAEELYRLKTQVNKEKYKNVANIAVGCMHKRSGKQNNPTLAASLYAWFEWHIKNLVSKFKNKGYNVIMITTDAIKIAGKYNTEDTLVTIGGGLGQFKVEYEGYAKYHTQGHYEEDKIKWKGKPAYMIDGYKRCKFVDNIEEEKPIYEKYAITKKAQDINNYTESETSL